MTNELFNELVSKMFSCNIMLLSTEDAKRLFRNQFDANIDTIFNQFSVINNLNLTIRDMSHNALALNGLRFRFTEWQTLKSRPNGSQVKKMLFDVISSMSNCGELESSHSFDTPWFHKWLHLFIETFDTTDHDFIGTYFGCFFIITAKELNNFKDILASLLAQAKQLTSIRWIQPDFVRYYIVISEDSFEPTVSSDMTTTYNELNSVYSNSFLLNIEKSLNNENNDEVFNDKHIANDVNEDVNHLIEDENDDPLSASLVNKIEMTKRFSSDSDHKNNAILSSAENISDNDLSNSTVIKSILDKLSQTIESLLKDFISKVLIPWSEKQIKLLNESISQRKGLRRSIFSATKSLINNMSSSTVGLKGANMNQSVIYSVEAPEMQQRKLADLAMSLTMYELAFNSYYNARKEFQSEGAWLYYASASEASALASFYTQKFNRHHFEQAINCYIETCKSMNYATRATILATESIRHYWPNDAANLFIRMTGDDSDLRSALFLEQASKCFAATNCRTRKAAFHYVLAGHRYHRCGLKHFALACYRRFNSVEWSSAADHVNLTIARLYLSIANNSNISYQRYPHYRKEGLELLRINANKQIFYQELLREVRRDLENTNNSRDDRELIGFQLDVPSIINVSIEPIEGSFLQGLQNICYVNEEIVLKLLIVSPFNLELNKLKLYCDNENANCVSIELSLKSFEETVIYLHVIPRKECEIEILGIEYEAEDIVVIRREISDKVRKSLKFRSIRTLPLIGIDLTIALGNIEKVETSSLLQVFCGEIIEMFVILKVKENGWKPSNMVMTTNANIVGELSSVNKSEYVIGVGFDCRNAFKVQIPSQIGHYSIHFKLHYTDESQSKTRYLTKTVDFNVVECLHIEGVVENVVSLRNMLINDTITVCAIEKQSLEIPATLIAHILVDQLSIRWSVAHRNGVISCLANL